MRGKGRFSAPRMKLAFDCALLALGSRIPKTKQTA
jgi:hypothetical protein